MGQIKPFFLLGCKVQARQSDIVYLKLLRHDFFFCLSFLLLFIDEFRFPSPKFLIVLCNISCRLKEVFLHYKYDKTWCLVQTMNLKQTFWLNLTQSKTPLVSNKLYRPKKSKSIRFFKAGKLKCIQISQGLLSLVLICSNNEESRFLTTPFYANKYYFKKEKKKKSFKFVVN